MWARATTLLVDGSSKGIAHDRVRGGRVRASSSARAGRLVPWLRWRAKWPASDADYARRARSHSRHQRRSQRQRAIMAAARLQILQKQIAEGVEDPNEPFDVKMRCESRPPCESNAVCNPLPDESVRRALHPTLVARHVCADY